SSSYRSLLFPDTPLFRSVLSQGLREIVGTLAAAFKKGFPVSLSPRAAIAPRASPPAARHPVSCHRAAPRSASPLHRRDGHRDPRDRKSTRLNSSHVKISY